MKQFYLYLFIIFLSTQYLSAQDLDATITVNGSNQLVITINTAISFQFNQTHTGVPSLVIDEVYAADAPSLTTSVNGGSGISFTGSNGTSGTVTQMGPFGFDYGMYTIRDEEITFSDPGPSFSSGDIITIQAGTIISLATFNNPVPIINPGPYNAFIVSDDYFSVAAIPIVLPVELTHFSGRKTDKQISLNWETASETNNQGFKIEHADDGETWEKMGFVNGKGTTTEVNQYEFIHENPNAGKNYYRLKQIDVDGNYEYSKVINIEYSEHEELVIIPNPSTGIINIFGIGKGKITILDTSGRVVKEQLVTGEEVDISDLPMGIFFIRIWSGNQSFSKRIMKSK
jgi:hypothetical protein